MTPICACASKCCCACFPCHLAETAFGVPENAALLAEIAVVLDHSPWRQ